VIAAVRSRVGITGLGACVPERTLANAELEHRLQTGDAWILGRTGIRERRIAEDHQATSLLALGAARAALADAGCAAEDVDLVILATVTPDLPLPASASLVQAGLGATNAGAYDLACACAGFVYALAHALSQVHAGLARRVLVVGAETLSRITDWGDRSTCVLFGDGAGAALVEADVHGEEQLLALELGSDGTRSLDLHVPSQGDPYMRMNGPAVYRFAGRIIVESAQRLLDHCGLGVEDVDWLVPHQANQRILDLAVARLGLDPARALANLDRYGNTSAASIPLVLADAAADGKLRHGDRLLVVGYGAGLAWGSVLITWNSSAARGGAA
jgi:3-oxoacyl-[acyl-carrier-protein] synthase-3